MNCTARSSDCIGPPNAGIHNIFRICKLVLTGTSILLAVTSIFIISQTPRISKEFARLLIILIINASLFDIYSQLIFDPQYIMPYLCVYRDAPLIHIPFRPAWGFIIWTMLVALNIPLYAACFIYRHQILLPPESSLILHTKARIAAIIGIAIGSQTYGFPYIISCNFVEQGWIRESILSADWDSSIPDRMECLYEHAELRNGWTAYLAFASCTFVTVSAVPLILIVVPISVATFYYLLLPIDQQKLPLMDIATLINAFHTFVISLVLILTTPVFRKQAITVE